MLYRNPACGVSYSRVEVYHRGDAFSRSGTILSGSDDQEVCIEPIIGSISAYEMNDSCFYAMKVYNPLENKHVDLLFHAAGFDTCWSVK